MRSSWKILVALVVAMGITLFSGLFPTPHISGPIPVDVAEYGAPLPWMTRVIPTRFNSFHWSDFMIDLGFWMVVCLILLGVLVAAKGNKRRTKTV